MQFEVNFDDVFDKTLWLSVWDDHPDGRDSFMGEVRLALARLDLRSNDLLHYTLQRRVSQLSGVHHLPFGQGLPGYFEAPLLDGLLVVYIIYVRISLCLFTLRNAVCAF